MRGENRAYLEIKIRGRISNTVEIDRENRSLSNSYFYFWSQGERGSDIYKLNIAVTSVDSRATVK